MPSLRHAAGSLEGATLQLRELSISIRSALARAPRACMNSISGTEASKRAPLMLLGPSRNNLSSAGKVGPSLPYGSSSGRVSCGSVNKSKREFRRECLPPRLFHLGIVAVDRVLG